MFFFYYSRIKLLFFQKTINHQQYPIIKKGKNWFIFYLFWFFCYITPTKTLSPPPASFQLKKTPADSPPSPLTLSTTFETTRTVVYKKKYALQEEYHSTVLISQFQQLERYWTEPNNLQRKESAVNQVTHKKRKERLLCFLGWCKEFEKVHHPDLTLLDVAKSLENRFVSFKNTNKPIFS